MAFWYPASQKGYFCATWEDTSADLIFFLEALTVTCALLHATADVTNSLHILIYSDNSNTIDIFNSLHAQPLYNDLLKSVVDAIIAGNHKLKVLHIPGAQNICADLLSRGRFDEAHALFPSLNICNCVPPQELLGAEKK